MERVGFKVDKDYLQQSKVAVKEYIIQRRQDMYSIAGRELSVGQHALIKEILAEMGLIVPSTGKEELDIILSNLNTQKILWQQISLKLYRNYAH